MSKQKPKRRTKADTITAQVEAAQDAMARAHAGPLEPPSCTTLRPTEMPFWEAITAARARSGWNRVDLIKAANLARCLADIERVTKRLRKEGDVVRNKQGTRIVNPLHPLLETLTKRSIALSRALHVHAAATKGRANEAGADAKKEHDADKAAETVERGKGLLARPAPGVH